MPLPDPSAAAILQAADLIRHGQWQQADSALAGVLTRNPDEPDALQLLGLVREAQDRPAEAETLLRRSLALRPNQPHVQVHLGRILAQTGRPRDAIALLQTVAQADPSLFDAVILLAQAQFTIGDLAAAEQHYRSALALAPGSQVARLGLAVLLNRTLRPAEAEPLLRTAANDAARPAPWQAKLARSLALSLDLQGRPWEAVTAWQRAVALDPTNAEAHRELNALLYRMGDTRQFLTSFDEAIRRLPASPERGALLLQKAGLLVDAERFDEAREYFAQVAAIAPNSAGPQNGLAVAYAGMGQFDAAIAAYEKSLRLQPNDPATKIRLACVLLQSGEAARALRLTEEVVPRNPLDQLTLAVHELALRANDDLRAERLADYERHIRIYDLDAPPGFATMAEFNAALNAHLDTLHVDLREHVDQTLRHGTQTAPALLRSHNELVGAWRQRVQAAVNDYIAAMPDQDNHPLSGRRRTGFDFAGSWSSRLQDCGFHANHIHPEGWISSCYYVSVPDVARDPATRQGWIKFGEPSFKTAMRDTVRRAVQPVPGRLVLFPSYMWHGTIPFHAATSRTTIAFDAIPT